MSGRDGRELSPNQLEKQRQIIEAARVVLARDGLAGATARAVADASPLTKSAIHYYFADMDEIVDAAMAGHIAGFVERVRASAEAAGNSRKRVLAAVDGYLDTFRELPNGLVLWNEYWIDCVRRDRTAAIEGMLREVTTIFTDLLDGDAVRAEALVAFLSGAAMQEALTPIPRERLHAQVSGLAGL